MKSKAKLVRLIWKLVLFGVFQQPLPTIESVQLVFPQFLLGAIGQGSAVNRLFRRRGRREAGKEAGEILFLFKVESRAIRRRRERGTSHDQAWSSSLFRFGRRP